MIFFLAIILNFVLFFSVSANDDTCRILNLENLYIGMTMEELSDKMEISKMEYYFDFKNHLITAEMFVRHSDINRLDIKFHMDEWENDSIILIPKDAILTYLVVTYNLEVEIESNLLLEYGAPSKETMPEIKQIFFFDKQWNCKNKSDDNIQITLTDKRVEYKLLEE